MPPSEHETTRPPTTTTMKCLIQNHRQRASLSIALAAATTAAAVRVPAAEPAPSVSEPPAVVYGRVVSHIGDREYVWTSGDLRWEIASPLEGGRSYQYDSALAPLADGRFSYALRIPMALLAFDLAVPEADLPLTGGGAVFRHEVITVDGIPCLPADPATQSFTLGQVQRGQTFAVDLVMMAPNTDQDGDGAPDWLERREGRDPYDPEDGAPLLASLPSIGGSDPGGDGRDDQLTNFAAWRAHHFPGDESDLEAFACGDADGDGICHLNEYAFMLDPKRRETGAAWSAMPRIEKDADGIVLVYRPRQVATDLTYVVEESTDLRHWNPADVTPAEGVTEDGIMRHRPITAPSTSANRVFRVQVVRTGE